MSNNNFLDQILPTVAQIAPVIASAFGGPLAGAGVTALEGALGVSPGSSQTPAGQEAITQRLLAGLDPQTMAAMKKADEDFQALMDQHKIDLAKINEQDSENARNMQVQTRDITPRLIGGAVVLGLFGLLGLLAFHEVPSANRDVLVAMVGALAVGFQNVLHFYFGSSAGSQGKDATIQQAVSKI